jgi:hypothetical protein
LTYYSSFALGIEVQKSMNLNRDDSIKALRAVGCDDPCGAAGIPLFIPKRVQDLVTLIVTTSIIPCHPFTRLIEEVLASHSRYEPELDECPKIIVCDFPKVSLSGVRQYKSGKVLEQDLGRYNDYITSLEAFAAAGEAPFRNTKILRCRKYRGFAMAVYECLNFVKTPFVMIIQHDRVLIREFGVRQILDLMLAERSLIKYVGLSNSQSDGQIHQMNSRYRIDLTVGLRILNNGDEDEVTLKRRLLANATLATPKYRRILVPLMFWYDSTHIACVEHYKNFVYREHFVDGVPRYVTAFKIRTGDFIEDKLGQAEREDIKANGLQAHAKYGTFMLEDGLGPFVQHCHGRLMGTSSARTFEIYFGDKE